MVSSEEAARLAKRVMSLDYDEDVVTFDSNELNTDNVVVRASDIELIWWRG